MDTPIHSGTAAGDRVLETASELFAAEGLYQVGVNRIIEEAGVAKATFYRHYPSRNDLVLAYVDGLGYGWAGALREAAGPFATHPADQLLGMFDALASSSWKGVRRREFRRPTPIRRSLPGPQPGKSSARQ